MTNTKRPVGFWIVMIVGILIFLSLMLGQVMSFIDYDFTVAIGLQESVDAVGEMGVAMNKGFGVGDAIVYVPLLALGLAGLWRRRKWGVFLMTGALGITAYFPIVCLFILLFARGVPGFNFDNFLVYTILLLFVASYAIWGMWYLYQNRKILICEE